MRVRFVLGGLALLAPAALAQSRTFTLDADFDEGVLLNVNHDSPNNDQLQLNQLTTPFPFVNIACSSRGTIVRIDVDTGEILGEYLTAPDGMGRNPSRTTVDLLGNVWVSNRDESGFSGGQGKGSITRVGLVIGGTRTDSSGVPDPNGEYLAPPFAYNTCVDRDGDGLIHTSRGLGNILGWSNAGGADTHGGVSTAADEAIINYTRITGTNARTVAIDASNDVWTGGLGDLDHEKISGVTGLPIAGTQFNRGCGGYGGLVDGAGILWSARGGAGLLRYDPTPATHDCLDFSHGDYGLAVDPATGHIWHTTLSSGVVVELAPDGTVLNSYGHGSGNAQGVAVDAVGNVWVAHSLFGATTVGHLRTNGTFVGNVSLPGGVGPTGVAVDANGKVWVANISTDNVMRIDPAAGGAGGGGFPIGAVDLTVPLGAGAGPYNYSDMTGFVSIGSTSPQGTWTVVHDTGAPGTADATVSWTSSEPAGTGVTVEVRAADAAIDLPSQLFVPVTNGGPVAGVAGRFFEIRATLTRAAAVDETPILFDLTISFALPCFALDFETEDDLATELENGQHIDVEFGNVVTITSSGPNAGVGVFDSTPGGPNDPSQDRDLLVGTGNVLILQTENFPPDANDVYPRPNDDEDGGTLHLTFTRPMEATSVRLIDLDAGDGATLVVLVDGTGADRTYTVPANWTGDILLGQPGHGVLDLTTLAPQPGFGSVATAVEDAGFDALDVVAMRVVLDGSGAVDDLGLCTPSGLGATVRVRNGSGVNPMNLVAATPPRLGTTWSVDLDCTGLGRFAAVLLRRQTSAGPRIAIGEVLITGPLLLRVGRLGSGAVERFELPVPFDLALCGLEGHAQGRCTSPSTSTLSNALDLVVGF